MNKTFDNYVKLLEFDEDLAKELLESVGEGGWQQEEIYYYESVEDYAEYELTEGWYSSSGLNIDEDFNGAPNPMSFIDLTKLGDALVESWDVSCHYKSDVEEVLATSHGW